MFIFALIVIVGIIIFLFVSRSFSPIPYFPSNRNDIPKIISALNLSSNQVVYDLGAGDGIVIFAAANKARQRKFNTQFVAVEINPVLLIILWIRRLLHPNRKNIQIMYGDIFSIRYTKYDIRNTKFTFFTYISPWYLEKVFKNCKLQIKTLTADRQDFKFISYFYPVPKLKPSRTIKGEHSTYVYNS